MALLHNVFMRASVRISYRWAAPGSTSQYVKSITQLRYYSVDKRPAPAKTRGGSKVFRSADEAIADVKDGDVILSAGFGLCGVAGMSLYLSYLVYLCIYIRVWLLGGDIPCKVYGYCRENYRESLD